MGERAVSLGLKRMKRKSSKQGMRKVHGWSLSMREKI